MRREGLAFLSDSGLCGKDPDICLGWGEGQPKGGQGPKRPMLGKQVTAIARVQVRGEKGVN